MQIDIIPLHSSEDIFNFKSFDYTMLNERKIKAMIHNKHIDFLTLYYLDVNNLFKLSKKIKDEFKDELISAKIIHDDLNMYL